MTLTWGWDATHNNLSGVPAGQGAGYTTGTRDIKWTAADWAAHPGAVRICQDAAASDDTADELDVETYAATPAAAAGWFPRALAAFRAGTRPGQRYPVIYCSLDAVAAVADALAGTGELGKPKLHVADWSWTMDEAALKVGTLISGLVVVGVQFANRGYFDSDVWDSQWLAGDVPVPVATPPVPSSPTVEEIMAPLPELAAGSSGPAVRTLQALLVARSFHLGTTGAEGCGIDGEFGPLTESAVKAFQEEQKITADGIAGPVTWPLLPQV